MSIDTVLIVDDDEDIRIVCGLAVEKIGGWKAVQAAGGEEALVAAREERPDVILLDVMMPGMDGPAVFARLRDDPVTEKIPVIFLTARSQERELEGYRALGAAGVIVKPFDIHAFAETIRRIVAGEGEPGRER